MIYSSHNGFRIKSEIKLSEYNCNQDLATRKSENQIGFSISNPEWHNSKVRPYFHQISIDCIDKLVGCMESIDIEDMDCDTCLKMQEILDDEIDDTEFLSFAIDNFSELFGYIASGIVNIRIHMDTEEKIWFGAG